MNASLKIYTAPWRFWLLLFAVLVIYFLGLNIDLIDVDAGQYASIAMEMIQRNDWLHITERGVDYLDKPPLLFWLAALSIKCFGYHNIAYKLPALLFSVIAMYATYGLAAHLYNRKVACSAVVILGTSIGFIWINMDVKTDVLLMGAVVYSIYSGMRYIDSGRVKFALAFGLGIGAGMLAKGPIGLIAPVAALGTHLVMTRRLSVLFRYGWWLALGATAFMLLPMCIGLYQQFDLHPEKIVNGRQGVSGLRFYFWDQSFGRITGENPWKNHRDFSYLFHSSLMLALPWSLPLGAAFLGASWQALRGRAREWVTLGGIWLVLSALSLSSYKIPHYAMVVFPLLAILTAAELERWMIHGWPRWYRISAQATVIFSLLAALFIWCCFPPFPLVILGMLVSGALAATALKKEQMVVSPLSPFVWSGVLVGLVFNGYFMGRAESYMLGGQLARVIQQEAAPAETVCAFNPASCAAEFYLHDRLCTTDWNMMLSTAKTGRAGWYIMEPQAREELIAQGLKIIHESPIRYWDLNRINFLFMNPQTRESSLKEMYLIRIAGD